jgi:cardiolipin synthase A/B
MAMTLAFKAGSYKWLHGGEEIFSALATSLQCARKSIRLEIYIYANDELGQQFRDILVQASVKGVRVQVLIDAFGSAGLPSGFWKPLTDAGGEVRWCNPEFRNRFSSRDHRKIMVCDEEVAFVGGFNIAMSYQGDGVNTGWMDLGLRLVSPLAVQLAAAFDEMFTRAGFQSGDHPHQRVQPVVTQRKIDVEEGELLLSGPGRGRNPFNRSLRRDLAGARNVQIIAAYFLPTWRIRRTLIHTAKAGGRVQLILPAKSDVFLSQLACRSLYRRLLRAGVEIYEYQPQVLHAKLIMIDDVVYVGSSNLDPRSLYINYELMLRFRKEKLVAEARSLFADILKNCKRIELESWRKSRNWWSKLKQRWAYFLLVRVDPMIARWQTRRGRN